MENKTILITGGSSGVGRALVDYLSLKNKVITVARRYEKLNSLYKYNPNVSYFKGDLSNTESLNEVIMKIDDKHKSIDCIINCIGVLHLEEVEKLDIIDVEKSLFTNALAPMAICKHYISNMKKNNYGRIINLTSGAPLNCFPTAGAYSASKGALNLLTVTLAREIVGFDIKINLMSPGPVKSDMAPDAKLDPSICFPTVDFLLSEVKDSGKFYWLGYEIPLFPDLGDVNWLEGKAGKKMHKLF